MQNEWMLDVIEDLRRFADLNDMPRLSVELSQVAATARAEALRLGEATVGGASRNAELGWHVSGGSPANEDA